MSESSLTNTGLPAPWCVIVVPCYNESQRLHLSAFQEYVCLHEDCLFLFIDDGSTDNTADILKQLARHESQRIRMQSLPQNSGKAEAVRQGLLAAMEMQPAVVGFWDADLATPLEAIDSIAHILVERADLDMVFGARVKLMGRSIDRNPLRHFLGRAFATAASSMLRLPVYDTQCGAKVFRATPTFQQVLAEPFKTNWVFDVELIARFIRLTPGGASHVEKLIYEYPLQSWRDVQGSKVKPTDFLRAIYELFTIYRSYLKRGTVYQPQLIPEAECDEATR